MKTFVYLLALTILLGSVGCKRRNPQITPLPPNATGAPGPEGLNPFDPRNQNPQGIRVPENTGPIGSSITENDTGFPASERPDGMLPDPEAFSSQTVYFDFDRSNVLSSEVGKVQEVADRLKAEPSNKVEVTGHCDERGTEEYNRSLGERRAQSVRELLISQGIAPERISTVSFGENQPVAFGNDDASHALNRRAEFILLRPPGAQ